MNTVFASCMMLRHYILHFIVGMILFLLVQKMFRPDIFFWILGTFLPDIDHAQSWIDPHNIRAKNTLHILEDYKNPLSRRLELATYAYWQNKHGFERLLLHNIYGIPFLLILFLFGMIHSLVIGSLAGAILVHQCVDLIGDIVRWHNIKHWL